MNIDIYTLIWKFKQYKNYILTINIFFIYKFIQKYPILFLIF